MNGVKLVTYKTCQGFAGAGAVVGDAIFDLEDWVTRLPAAEEALEWSKATGRDLAPSGLMRLLQSGVLRSTKLQDYIASLGGTKNVPAVSLDRAVLYAPIPSPGKIVAIGRNYGDHAKETGVVPFEKPRIVSKFPSALCGHRSVVSRPLGVRKFDFEVELAVVIGRTARCVMAADASQYVAGYTVLNDLSAREFQLDVSPPQTTYAKSADMFAPMGPWLVIEDIGLAESGLDLSLHLNDQLMQAGNTRDMLFSVGTLIEYLSHHCTLDVGDVIATGTPAGSGAFRQPPTYLQSGDSLRLSIEGVGVLEHSIG